MALNILSHILCPATITTIFIHSVNIIIYHSISGRSREFSVKIAVAYNKTSFFMQVQSLLQDLGVNILPYD